MDEIKAERIGHWAETSTLGEVVRAYVPKSLPLVPPLDMKRLTPLVSKADLALGRLDGVTSILPSANLFIFMYVRKEALLSSQIEGTQSSLSDLLLFEADEVPMVPLDDVQEVSSYIAALEHGLKRLKNDLPLSLRLLREIHSVLLSKGRGSSKQPGEFRRSQNWIGGTRPGNALFVPPPPAEMEECLQNLESFIHQDDGMPTILKAALVHVQFETIHPFLDGNGRLGRLLITFLLCADNILREPTLYLSLYFKTHRQVYYDLLQRVRTHGEWEEWAVFFLEGVAETADQAAQAAQDILKLFEQDLFAIQNLGRAAASASMVHQLLQRHVLTTTAKAKKELVLSEPTINNAFSNLKKLGIVREVTGKQKGRVYVYSGYLDILQRGTEVSK